MAKKIGEAFSGKFYPLVGVLLATVLIAGFFILKPRTSFGSSVSDTYSDTSKINTGASSNYVVSGGQLRMLFNSGIDGSITVTANKNINTDILTAGRSYADGVNAAVLSLGTNTIVVAGTFNGLAANDEVLLINLQGDGTNWGNVGKYEFLHVQSVNQSTNTTITLTTDIANIYGATNSNANLTGQKVMVQRVPNYTNVTINGGVNFSPSPWNGTIGGVIAFRANGTVSVAGNLLSWASGYKGGIPVQWSPGGDGESFCGVNMSGICGGGQGGSSPSVLGCNNGEAGSNTGGSGGGGGATGTPSCDDCGYTWGKGGGGGYGTFGYTVTAGSGAAVNGGSGVSGAGGQGCLQGPVRARTAFGGSGGGGGTYGSADLSTLFFGSGGGATGGSTGAGVAGGAGGGIVFVHAATLNVSGTINSGGQNIANGSCVPGYERGGGNGAGGSILLLGQSATLGSNLVSAPGGPDTTCNQQGGDGRIAIGITSYTGTTSPTFTGTSVPSATATVVSTNLLQGQTVNAIWSFDYTLSYKPTGSSATIQFSQNGTNWYNSSGTLNGTNTLSQGANNISLSALNWSGANFYYKIVFSGTASPVLDDVKLNFAVPLEAPTIGTPTALSTSSIRWAFTDNSTDEVAFKLFDNAGNWTFTCAGSNLTYCDETGLAAGTTYTRKVAASSNTNNDGTGVGLFSGTATKGTLSAVPQMPTVVSLSSSSLNVTVVPGPGAPTSDTYAIYFTTGSNPCNGSNGSYLQANGTLGASAVYQYDVTAHGTPAWNTKTVTGLNLDANNYNVCVQDKNAGGQTTAWGPANSCNGGWMSLSGYTYTGSDSSCGLTNSKLHDGAHNGKRVFGVDNGAGSNANTAILKVASGATLTVNAIDTLVAGSIQVDGEIALAAGAQIKPGGKLYVVDGDSDNYPKGDPNDTSFPALYYVGKTGDSPPTHNRRRTAIPTMAVTPDCNDFGTNAGQVHVPHAACYADLDSDTYTTGVMAGGNATCLSASTCPTSTYYSASTDTNAANTGTNTMRDAANGSDCNDANAAAFRSVNGYLDADSDTFGVGTLQTCVGATGNYTANNASDCYDNNPNVFPKQIGTGYCGTAYRGQTSQGALVTDNTAAGNSYIFNCNNGSIPVLCGTTYNYSRTGVSQCYTTNNACGCLGSFTNYLTTTPTCGGALAICTHVRTWCAKACECTSGTGCDAITNGTQGCF